MKRYWNNKVKIIISYKLLALCFMLSAGILFCWILYPEKANSGPYLDSAHANTSYGVNRTGLYTPINFGYSVGNCAHCHEQHASIGGDEPIPKGGAPSKYELFQAIFGSQSGGFCFGCHKDSAAVDCQQISLPFQYNYSRISGGDTNACPNDIKEAFQFVNKTTGAPQSNCSSSSGSSHYLDDIQTFLRTRWNFGSVAADINPCSGCHNPHRAKRDFSSPPQSFVWTSGVSSLSRPSRHSKDNNVWDLWGDDSTERMSNYYYQAPYRYNSTTTYEPDGFGSDGSGNASRNVDSVTFCLDCHQYQITGTARTVKAIDWNSDIHGAAPPQTECDYGDKNPPYTEGVNYVLSCLDCHEPHGSRNEFLLRQEVNGKQIPIITISGYWWDFCTACHQNLNNYPNPGDWTKHFGGIGQIGSGSGCTLVCHSHGKIYNTTLTRCGCGSPCSKKSF